MYVPRDQLELFFAVALYWAGPKYASVLRLTLVTSRRISETLLLRGTDIRLQGGEYHDAGHILYQRRPEDEALGGDGKLGAKKVVARVCSEAIAGIEEMCSAGLEHEMRSVLEPFKVVVPRLFEMKPMNKQRFQIDPSWEDFVFSTASKKKHTRPNMSRQSVSKALKVIRTVMFAITGHRRYNPNAKFQGNRVTVHGATRHTSASLLLSNKGSQETQPSEHVILEIQQRTDPRVFWKHYFHPAEEQVKAALEYGAAPNLFLRNARAEQPLETLPGRTPCDSSTREKGEGCGKKTLPEPSFDGGDQASAAMVVPCPEEPASPGESMPTVAVPCQEPRLNTQKRKHSAGEEKQHKHVSRNAFRKAKRKENRRKRASQPDTGFTAAC